MTPLFLITSQKWGEGGVEGDPWMSPPLTRTPPTYGGHMLHWTFGSIFKMTKFILIISDSVISIISSLITDSELFRKKKMTFIFNWSLHYTYSFQVLFNKKMVQSFFFPFFWSVLFDDFSVRHNSELSANLFFKKYQSIIKYAKKIV